MARPKDLKYAESHEWLRLEKGEATVGITDFAVHELNDLVHLELPKVGTAVEAGKPFGEIESVKTVSDLYCPVNGKITAVNSALADALEDLARDPYGKGWMIKVKVADAAEANSLMSAAEYDAFLKKSAGEEHGGDDED